MCNLQSTKKLLGLKGLKDIIYYMSMGETDIMSELGDWKDCIAYPNYKISSTGAFMNKRTLKMLKHFIHKDSDKPAVTLYRTGRAGDVRDVELMLKIHFGDHASLPQVEYHHEKITELLPQKKTRNKKTQTDPIGDII